MLVFAGLSLDSAFGKASKHKTASQKNGEVDMRIDTDSMMKNGLVIEGRDKLKSV